MEFYLIFDLCMALLFFLFGFLFYRSNGKCANFLSGYNLKSPEERKKYPEDELCKCYGMRMMGMAAPFLLGAALDVYFVGAGCLVA